MAPTRNVSSLIILLLSLIVIHGLLAMTGKDSYSSMAESRSKAAVLGVTTTENGINQELNPGFHETTIFFHRFFTRE